MKDTYRYDELVELIENHDFEPVKNWLQAGGDPNLLAQEDNFALLFHVMWQLQESIENQLDKNRLLELIELFLKSGATINPDSAHAERIIDSVQDLRRLLFEALFCGNSSCTVLKLFVQYGINCNVIDKTDYPIQTPLIQAIENNDLESVRLIVPEISDEMLHFVGGQVVSTALGRAFWDSNEPMVEFLLKSGANPYFIEWDFGYIHSKSISPSEGRTYEQSQRLDELVTKFSQYTNE